MGKNNIIVEHLGEHIAVYGVGVTGQAVLDYLRTKSISAIVIDDSPYENLKILLSTYEDMITRSFIGDSPRDWDSVFSSIDTMIISPGIKLDPKAEEIAREKNIPIISEIEMAYRLCKGKIIAVTGSNGKSTTVTMIHKILDKAGIPSHLVGNIGKPFISIVDEIHDGDWVVVEVSSYQLERIEKFKPAIALITNITEDHLARHGDMKGYIAAKGRIFENQNSDDHAIINHEEPNTWRAFGNASSKLHIFASVDFEDLPVSEYINGHLVEACAALKSDMLAFRIDSEIDEIMSISELQVLGEHNIQNALASALAAHYAGVPSRAIASALKEFKGIEHRIEFLGEIDGVLYYNDSKATNVDSTITALKALSTGAIRLILGGSEKGSDFNPLYRFLKDRQEPLTLYLTGPSGRRMADEIETGDWNLKFILFDSFEKASNAAFNEAKDSDIILLSPACASFDEFKNFEERGRKFKELLIRFLKGKSD